MLPPINGHPRFSAISVCRSDAYHHEARATLSESLGWPPFRSRRWLVGGRRNVLPMNHIACDISPTRRTTYAIYRSQHLRSSVLKLTSIHLLGEGIYLVIQLTEFCFERTDFIEN